MKKMTHSPFEIQINSTEPLNEKQQSIRNYMQWIVDQPDFKDKVLEEVRKHYGL